MFKGQWAIYLIDRDLAQYKRRSQRAEVRSPNQPSLLVANRRSLVFLFLERAEVAALQKLFLRQKAVPRGLGRTSGYGDDENIQKCDTLRRRKHISRHKALMRRTVHHQKPLVLSTSVGACTIFKKDKKKHQNLFKIVFRSA